MRNRLVRHITVVGITGACLFLATAIASAQVQPVQPAIDTWSRGTTLGVSGGAASASPNTTSTYGAALGWEINHFTEIEGVAAWLAERKGAEGFAADLKLLVNLTRPALLVPYVGGGAGLYVASFDTGRTPLPSFYQQHGDSALRTGRVSFTDPTVVVAGGANIYVANHFSVRPEVGARFVINGSDTYTVTSLTFTLAFHVETHAVRNSRK